MIEQIIGNRTRTIASVCTYAKGMATRPHPTTPVQKKDGAKMRAIAKRTGRGGLFHLQHPDDGPAKARYPLPSLYRLGYLASDSDLLLCDGRGVLFVFGFDDLSASRRE